MVIQPDGFGGTIKLDVATRHRTGVHSPPNRRRTGRRTFWSSSVTTPAWPRGHPMGPDRDADSGPRGGPRVGLRAVAHHVVVLPDAVVLSDRAQSSSRTGSPRSRNPRLPRLVLAHPAVQRDHRNGAPRRRMEHLVGRPLHQGRHRQLRLQLPGHHPDPDPLIPDAECRPAPDRDRLPEPTLRRAYGIVRARHPLHRRKPLKHSGIPDDGRPFLGRR